MIRVILLILFVTGLVQLSGNQELQIIRAKNGKPIKFETMIKELSKKQVIFFGEFHGERPIHAMQHKVLQALVAKEARLIVSFEMFERDTQDYINMYLKDEMSEGDFLLNSRPWGNYESDYRPLLELAKAKKLPVIAANVPRYLAGRAVRTMETFKDNLSDKEKTYMAAVVHAPEDEYYQRFAETMNELKGAGMNSGDSMLKAMYYAQCLKDDTMAESIVLAMAKHPKYKVIHFNGDFHSRYNLGTVQRVKIRLPKVRTAVISPVHTSKAEPWKWSRDDIASGDYIIVVPQDTKPEEEKQP